MAGSLQAPARGYYYLLSRVCPDLPRCQCRRCYRRPILLPAERSELRLVRESALVPARESEWVPVTNRPMLPLVLPQPEPVWA